MQQTLSLPNPEDWLDIGQALERLEVSRATLYVMLADGRLSDFRIGVNRVFWRAQVVELASALQLVRKPPAT